MVVCTTKTRHNCNYYCLGIVYRCTLPIINVCKKAISLSHTHHTLHHMRYTGTRGIHNESSETPVKSKKNNEQKKTR